jgi:hypothetical protein
MDTKSCFISGALLIAAFASTLTTKSAVAQAGSTGGTIGKTDKSISGGENDESGHPSRNFKGAKHAQDIPNLAGAWRRVGICAGETRIVQSGENITCINERGSVTYGKMTGKRSFLGCWGLDASVSEDADSISWSNGTYWRR